MAVPSLFDTSTREQILTRLKKLNATSQAQWGKLDAPRMLAHVIDTFEVTFAERPVEVKKNWLNSAIGRWLIIDAPLPWPKGAPSSPVFWVTTPGEFETDRARVRGYVERFGKGTNQKFGPSPLMGQLSPEQWSRMHYRHLDWHLKQFGC